MAYINNEINLKSVDHKINGTHSQQNDTNIFFFLLQFKTNMCFEFELERFACCKKYFI